MLVPKLDVNLTLILAWYDTSYFARVSRALCSLDYKNCALGRTSCKEENQKMRRRDK